MRASIIALCTLPHHYLSAFMSVSTPTGTASGRRYPDPPSQTADSHSHSHHLKPTMFPPCCPVPHNCTTAEPHPLPTNFLFKPDMYGDAELKRIKATLWGRKKRKVVEDTSQETMNNGSETNFARAGKTPDILTNVRIKFILVIN